MSITAEQIKQLAADCGFELAGIAVAEASEDFARFEAWRAAGNAGDMKYLTDHRGDLRSDARNLLAGAKSIICVGKLYNTEHPHSTDFKEQGRGWISRYAWGGDYHDLMTSSLKLLAERIEKLNGEPFESRICVDTAPLLERSYARQAGLGWIGRNTCLINQDKGSWFFLGELLLSISLAPDAPPPDRCGTCRRCIEACPTTAIVPGRDGWHLDARLCISYLTIEKRGAISEDLCEQLGNHLFGCDICQDVCPWNRRAPFTGAGNFSPREYGPALQKIAALSEEDFRTLFRRSPVWRAKYVGLLRNAAAAMGNSGQAAMREPLKRLATHPDEVVAATARQALRRLCA